MSNTHKRCRLNLGSGDWPLSGYLNYDTQYAPAERGAYLQNCLVYPLDMWEDGAVDEVRASHILEHFSHRETANVLREWVRILRPGGWLKVAVPDFRKIAERYLAGYDESIQGYVMGAHVNDGDKHGAIFDEAGLRDALEQLGLVDIQPWESEVPDCASLPVTLNLMGRKPGCEDIETAPEPPAPRSPVEALIATHPDPRFAQLEVPQGAVSAVMTAPRLGFTSFMQCAVLAFTRLGIPLHTAFGVFWTQGLERVLESEALRCQPKYLLALDFDTVFDYRDVQTLYGLMEARPDIDALCAVQQRRDLGTTLIGMRDESGAPMAHVSLDAMKLDVLKVATGHFGLTLIRTQSLLDLPHPWFQETPDASGRWSAERVDADVAFWHKFAAAGKTLYQANRVVVGHCEQIVNWPDKYLRSMVQASGDYHAAGRPGPESGIWR